MSRADHVIILDNVQYSRHSWYNRNRIVTAAGVQWITVPIRSTGALSTKICDIAIASEKPWQRKMLRSIEQAYSKHPYFATYRDSLWELLEKDWKRIAALARASVEWSFDRVGRKPKLINASEIDVETSDPVMRLVELCRAVGAHRYLSGPSAKNYIIDNEPFLRANIELTWMSYDYPEYPQLRRSDKPLSILDLLFNVGDDAAHYIWPNSQEKFDHA